MVIVCLYHYTLLLDRFYDFSSFVSWFPDWKRKLIHICDSVHILNTRYLLVLYMISSLSCTEVKRIIGINLLTRFCMLVVMNMCFYEFGDRSSSGLLFNQKYYGSWCPEPHLYTKVSKIVWYAWDLHMLDGPGGIYVQMTQAISNFNHILSFISQLFVRI